MNDLKIPRQFSGIGVERNQRVTEQILSLPVGAVKIVGGRTEGKKYQAPLEVDAHEAPDIGSGAILPATAFPGVIPGFAGMRY